VRKILSLMTCALILTITGCASSSKAPAQPKVVKSITLIPVLPPENLSTENKGLPLGAVLIAYTIVNKNKSVEFDALYSDYRKNMGAKLTDAVAKELTTQGFKVQLATEAEATRDKDGEIDYKKFMSHDTVLDLGYSDVGMFSGRVTQYYLPMMNTYALLSKPSTKEYLMDEKYYYGAQANKDESWSIPSDPKFNFASFNDLVEKPDAVRAAYDEGIQKMAKQLAKDFAKKLTPAQ
jgi:hypothetical protein